MSGSDINENRNNEYPRISEDDWYVLAIVFSILTFVAAGFALWWIFHGINPDGISERATIAGMIVTFGGVVTTFCTVAWRGMITTRQADVSIQQIAETRRQIAVTEENNLATNLQKGAELIAEEGNEPKASAGIAMLHAVINSRSELFASVAQSLLLTYVNKNGASNHRSQLVKQCINSLNILDERFKVNANEQFSFSALDDSSNHLYDGVEWVLLQGAKVVEYEGGNIRLQEIKVKEGKNAFFESVRFTNCIIQDTDTMYFNNCRFRRCKFISINNNSLEDNNFINCNFSGTKIYGNSMLVSLLKGGNYYYSNDQPIIIGADKKQPPLNKIFKVRNNTDQDRR